MQELQLCKNLTRLEIHLSQGQNPADYQCKYERQVNVACILSLGYSVIGCVEK